MSGELVPEPVGEMEVHGGIPVQLPADPFASLPGMWCSWDKTQEGGATKVGRCLRAADMTAETDPDVSLQVEDVFLHIVQLANPATGEMVMAQRCVLLCADGRTYSTCSPYAFVGLGAVASIHGPPPWPGGVGVRVQMQRTRNKKMVLTFTPEG